MGLQAFVTPPGQTLLAQETLSDLHLAEGATPLVSSGASLPPLHVQAQLVPDVLVVDIGIAQKLLDRPEQISRLLIGKFKGQHEPLEKIAGDRLRLVEPSDESDLERLTDSFHLNLTAFGFLSFFVSLFIVNSAIGLAFEQRLPMLRTLRACGVSAAMLNAVLVAELVSLALVAGLIGLVCGYLIAAALLPDVAASLRGLYGAQIPGELTLRTEWWIAGIAISVLGALAAAATSLAKAIRLPILATAQPQAWQQAQHRWLMLQSALALAVFAVAALLLRYGDSLLAGFAVLAALLLGAALLLPAMLELVLHLGQRFAQRPLATWFWADSRQQLSGLSLALMALLLALAVNVGVGTMVETFSRTFATWLDGRLAADIYINASDNAQAVAIKGWLRERSEVQAILPGGRAETQLDGAPIEILGYPDHPTYRDHWPLLQSAAGAWTRLLPGDAGFISEQLARRLKLAIGDRIELPVPGGNWPIEIVGIYADYGNPKGQVAVNVAALIRHFPSSPQTRIGLRVDRDKIPVLMAALQEKFGLDDRNVADQATVKAEFEADLQPDLCGHRRVERVYAWRRRHRLADELVDARQFPTAAIGAAMGDRHHAPASCRDRIDQDAVGRADHRVVRAAARASGRLVPDRDRECESIRLAAAVRCLSAATLGAARRRDAGRAFRGIASGRTAGADAAGHSGQGVCR